MKSSTQSARRHAFDSLSRYVRVRDAIASTGGIRFCVCCTCGKVYPAFGKNCIQAGHFIQGRHNSIAFDERNVHGQCFTCNIRLKGNWKEYYRFMQARYGQAVIDELMKRDKMFTMILSKEFEEMASEWERKTKSLMAQLS